MEEEKAKQLSFEKESLFTHRPKKNYQIELTLPNSNNDSTIYLPYVKSFTINNNHYLDEYYSFTCKLKLQKNLIFKNTIT